MRGAKAGPGPAADLVSQFATRGAAGDQSRAPPALPWRCGSPMRLYGQCRGGTNPVVSLRADVTSASLPHRPRAPHFRSRRRWRIRCRVRRVLARAARTAAASKRSSESKQKPSTTSGRLWIRRRMADALAATLGAVHRRPSASARPYGNGIDARAFRRRRRRRRRPLPSSRTDRSQWTARAILRPVVV
jgi:hypothetical protein